MRAGRWTRSVLAGALGIALLVVTGGAAGASDETTAEKLVITKADVAKAHVGRGVTVGAPGGSDATPTDTFGPIAECVGKPVPGRAVVAVVHGPQLVDKAGRSSIGSNVDIVQTKAMAQADRAVVQSAAFPHCLAQVAEQQGAAGERLGRRAPHQAQALRRLLDRGAAPGCSTPTADRPRSPPSRCSRSEAAPSSATSSSPTARPRTPARRWRRSSTSSRSASTRRRCSARPLHPRALRFRVGSSLNRSTERRSRRGRGLLR